MMRVLGVIPARGGSRGIPNTHLRQVAGRPLLAFTADLLLVGLQHRLTPWARSRGS